MREALIGLSLGFAARVLVAGAEFAGHLAGFQLGFSYANLVDPQSGVRNGILSALYGTLAIVVFFAHRRAPRPAARAGPLLRGAAGRAGASSATAWPTIVTRLLGLVFVLGAQLAAPVVIVLLVAELRSGCCRGRAPMLNLMAQGFPIRLLVGLLALAAMIRVLPGVIAVPFRGPSSSACAPRRCSGTAAPWRATAPSNRPPGACATPASKGQIARSKDLAEAAQLLATLLVLGWFGHDYVAGLGQAVQRRARAHGRRHRRDARRRAC